MLLTSREQLQELHLSSNSKRKLGKFFSIQNTNTETYYLYGECFKKRTFREKLTKSTGWAETRKDNQNEKRFAYLASISHAIFLRYEKKFQKMADRGRFVHK